VTRYNSKIGLEITLPLLMIMAGLSIYLAFQKEWAALAIICITTLAIFFLFRSTYYIIDGNILKVKASFLINKSIDINGITRIKETRNPLSAPAASLDRLEIKSKQDTVLISPKDKKAFIKELQSLNSSMEVILRKS